MHLFQVLEMNRNTRFWNGNSPFRSQVFSARRRLKKGFKAGNHRLVFYIPCSNHKDSTWDIKRVDISEDGLFCYCRNSFSCSQNRHTDGMVGPEKAIKQHMDIIIRRIFHHADLLEDHLPLTLHVIGIESRIQENIRKDIRYASKVFAKDLSVKTGILLACKCIGHSPDCIQFLCDLKTGAIPRSLKNHVFNKMGDTVLRPDFVTRTGIDPYTKGNGSQMV